MFTMLRRTFAKTGENAQPDSNPVAPTIFIPQKTFFIIRPRRNPCPATNVGGRWQAVEMRVGKIFRLGAFAVAAFVRNRPPPGDGSWTVPDQDERLVVGQRRLAAVIRQPAEQELFAALRVARLHRGLGRAVRAAFFRRASRRPRCGPRSGRRCKASPATRRQRNFNLRVARQRLDASGKPDCPTPPLPARPAATPAADNARRSP